MTIVLPLAAVLFGTGAFGAENDEGTILYLLAKPISRWVHRCGQGSRRRDADRSR